MIKKNQHVEIYQNILSSHERADHLPKDTKQVPYEVRIKGRLLEDHMIGDVVSIETQTGRIEQGILIKENPSFSHSFGHFVDEVEQMKDMILKETENL